MAAQVPNFALAPALVGADVIDYSTSAGTKIYKSACEPLPHTFDCSPAGLKVFLADIRDRAITTGWQNIIEIPTDPDDEDVLADLCESYGLISLEQVRAHAATYVNAQTRAAQNSMQLYQCIMTSLTVEGKAKVELNRIEYTVGLRYSGACLLKVVISLSYIDTNATTTFIRGRLSSLDSYIRSINSDVEKFNTYVKNQLDSLNARGESTQDLLANLFKGYAQASDQVFTAYIAKKQDEYHDGNDLEPEHLMQLALNKYQTMVEGGKWNAPTEADSKIIALEAQVKKLSRAPPGKAPVKSKGGNVVSDNLKAGKAYKDKRIKPEWMSVAPKEGEPKKKTIKNKTFWWCPKHNAWVRHPPEECEGKGLGKSEDRKPAAKRGPPQQGSKALQLSKALASIVDQDEEDEE